MVYQQHKEYGVWMYIVEKPRRRRREEEKKSKKINQCEG